MTAGAMRRRTREPAWKRAGHPLGPLWVLGEDFSRLIRAPRRFRDRRRSPRPDLLH